MFKRRSKACNAVKCPLACPEKLYIEGRPLKGLLLSVFGVFFVIFGGCWGVVGGCLGVVGGSLGLARPSPHPPGPFRELSFWISRGNSPGSALLLCFLSWFLIPKRKNAVLSVFYAISISSLEPGPETMLSKSAVKNEYEITEDRCYRVPSNQSYEGFTVF